MKGEKTLYRETQCFNQTWIIWLMLVINGLAIGPLAYGFYQQIILGNSWGNQPMSDSGLIILSSVIIVVMIVANGLILSSKLEIEVTNQRLIIRFPPLLGKKEYQRDEISDWQVAKYNPIWDYGGWGIRMGMSFKIRALSVGGSYGLKIEPARSGKLLIGTQRPEALKHAMGQMMGTE